ncbi:autotransporter outer membrane beta-barrel domain-containing protein [Yoonia sp.]|uniref:autotransporter outer membrane beta-barrel domain-containing protein n=1 Tax=Yoonia sp. TaxID=2212373 RepID=UPI0039192B01
MSRLHTTTAIAAAVTALQVLAAPAHAECLTGGDTSTPTLTCTATDSGNIDDDRDNLAILVESDAVLMDDNRPIQLGGSDQSIINNGLIESSDSDAIRASGENLTITNAGTIRGGDRGIRLQDDANGFTLNNLAGGQILALNQAVRLDNDDVLENATITNRGLIQSTNGRAIQSRGPGGTVVNHGTLRGGEEVIEAREGFTLENHGLIALNGLNWDAATRRWTNDGATSDEDGVQFASGRVDNYGTILGTDDGIDIDEGVIHNHRAGVIISTGSAADPLVGGSGIDIDEVFEPSVGAGRVSGPVTIINEGYIEGVQAIGVADGHISDVTIRNSGILRGRSGTAILLGDGDNTLEIDGGQILGQVNLGGGSNTLRVIRAGAGVVSFVAAPDNIDLTDAANALFSGTLLVAAEPRVFSAADRLFSDAALAMSRGALAQSDGAGWWIDGRVLAQDDDQTQTDRSGAFTWGRDFGAFGVFVAASTAQAELGGGDHEVAMTGATIGLRARHDLGTQTSISGAVFAGQSRMTLTSPDVASGSGDSDGMHYGLTARAAHVAPAQITGGRFGYDLIGQAGFVAGKFDSYDTSGLGGAGFDERDTSTAFAGVEAGLLVGMANAITLRPFVGAHVVRDANTDGVMSLNGDATRFDVPDTDHAMISLGVDVGGTRGVSRWNVRAEARYGNDDRLQGLASLSMRF